MLICFLLLLRREGEVGFLVIGDFTDHDLADHVCDAQEGCHDLQTLTYE